MWSRGQAEPEWYGNQNRIPKHPHPNPSMQECAALPHSNQTPTNPSMQECAALPHSNQTPRTIQCKSALHSRTQIRPQPSTPVHRTPVPPVFAAPLHQSTHSEAHPGTPVHCTPVHRYTVPRYTGTPYPRTPYPGTPCFLQPLCIRAPTPPMML